MKLRHAAALSVLKVSDRALAILAIIVGLIGLILAVISLQVGLKSAPWRTWNDIFCAETKHGAVCASTREACGEALEKVALEVRLQGSHCKRLENYDNSHPKFRTLAGRLGQHLGFRLI